MAMIDIGFKRTKLWAKFLTYRDRTYKINPFNYSWASNGNQRADKTKHEDDDFDVAVKTDRTGTKECLNLHLNSESSTPILKTVRVYRWNPLKPEKAPYMQTFTVNLKECGTMVLDILIKIKSDQDQTLAFRRSCREGICGSCSMNINGVNGLACITKVTADAKPLIIYPLPHAYVLRDLVSDMKHFLDQYKLIDPHLKYVDKNYITGSKQLLQSPRDRSKLNGLYECIMCGCCSFACPSYWWQGEKYLGPAVLLQAYRWIIDSRDGLHEERLSKMRDFYSVFRCRSIFNCTKTCPIGLNPGRAIVEIKRLLAGLAKKEPPDFPPDMLQMDPCTGEPVKYAKKVQKDKIK